jgi:hypothetical protein
MQVEVVLRERDGSRFVHLINYANQRFGQDFHPVVMEDVVPVMGIPMEVRGRAAAVLERPSGRPLPFEVVDLVTRFTVPRLDIHTIVEVQFAN